MSLHAPTTRRERVLLYGPPGGGKSTAWLDLAEWLRRTKAKVHIPVLDTDKAWDDMAPYDGHLDDIVSVFPCLDWASIRENIRRVEKMMEDAGADDWFVTDMAHRIWDKAQEGFFEKVFGKDIDEFFTLAQGDRQKAISGDYGANWQAINKLYGTFTNIVMRWPGHVLVCTSAQKIWEANEKDKVLVTYPEFARLGWKPQGQKDLAHQFRTILFLQESPSGWRWSTAKERNPPSAKEGEEGYRAYYAGEVMKSFTKDYLMKVGGWKL